MAETEIASVAVQPAAEKQIDGALHQDDEENDTVGELRTDFNAITTDHSSPLPRSPFHKFRGSIAWTEGFEKNLHVLGKDQYPDRAMAVFTSGGDAQGSSK
ncbi:unnamed protein product [Rotaria magnacalcarata]|uniref:Uncharacterized protein n=1 Tax=Rotaria magnacalcarata TaxID=392030 RepID=A0A814QR08_9BILA|nr:unnamed protein product [Rotaria magnacalcarata]CAF3873602.1 unnamed protein product [Rotaria magnacalcarata]CAF4342795.1 unnamed protein product [Rotaria magnacalcarata]